MSNKITPQQFETLEHIANGINAEIAAYNDANDVVHQVIGVNAYSNEDEDGHNAYFEITTFRTHSAAEETLVHKAIDEIGKKLVDAGIPDTLEHTGDCSEGYNFTGYYTIAKATTHTAGPWTFGYPNRDTIYILSKDNVDNVAMLKAGTQAEANARLIAAAPDLLDALRAAQMALIGIVSRNEAVQNALNMTSSAIAKATK